MIAQTKVEEAKIKEAKSQSLLEVIKSKGITVKRSGQQHLALCPFHDDHNPSLSIDTKTNLFKCFGCGASGDAIRFIELYDKKSFPEAVQTLTNESPNVERPTTNNEMQQLLNRVAALYHQSFLTSSKPQEYLRNRGLTKPELYTAFRLGYADGKLLKTIPQEGPIVVALKRLGVLTAKGKELFSGCVTFPLFDTNGNVTGLYGRKITNTGTIHHLYLPGKRRGIVNRPAAVSAETLILTESIIDALSLYQNGYPNAIPLYGTNGLTADHLELFRENRPQKIYLCLNSDQPGQEATTRISETLTKEGFKVGIINLPEHNDLNEYFQAGKTFDDFTNLIIEAEKTCLKPGCSVVETEIGLVITCQNREYRIRGLNQPNPERLRVNLRAVMGDKYHIDTIDLYQSKSRKYLSSILAKLFTTETGAIDADLFFIINQIEAHQAKEETTGQVKKEYQLTPEEESQALNLLKAPNLLENILADIETIGHVGEETNKILAYLISVSRKLPKPLSGIVVSQSAAGKSGLVETVQELTPPEEVEFFSRITPQALYYMDRDALKRKLLIIEERTGGEGADYSIRTLQSRQKLTQAVPIKDPNSGKIKTMTFEVEGPIAYLETTTSATINHENATRCFELYLDETPEQTRRIHQAQRAAKTSEGLAKKSMAEAIKKRHHNLQRMLKPVLVEIPFALELDFPVDSLRTRRDHERFLSLIEAVAFLFQYQRQQQEITTQDGEKAIAVLATTDDYARAYELAREILGFTLDDLKKHARELLETIQAMVETWAKETEANPEDLLFTRREIREYSGWPDHQIKTYIKQLEEMEYLIIENTKERGQFCYRLNNPGKRKPLKGLLTPEELQKRLTGMTGRNGISTSQIQ